ncbi:frataxin [Acrasis kona]|uniref:Frataxin n=1 Tax=Acrasis kona TaxID=1008807 RepID=A0AAW2ZQY5_9EUKA
MIGGRHLRVGWSAFNTLAVVGRCPTNISIRTPLRSVFTRTSNQNIIRSYSKHEDRISQSQYLQLFHSTTDSISEVLDHMMDNDEFSDFIEQSKEDVDMEVSDGVLNIKAGDVGTFVISRQTPTKQLWLSSPISGPWHYTFNADSKDWVCTKDKENFMDRLERELKQVFGKDIKFERL